MRIFRKGPGPHALPMAVVGVRLGNRLLDVGADAAALFAEMAGKSGLTGQASAVVGSERDAARVRAAAAAAGVLADVLATAWPVLPIADAAFDVAVLDNTRGMVAALTPDTRAALAAEVLRALRPGGRVVILDRPAHGLRAVFGRRGDASWAAPAAAALLSGAGFKPVRLLAEREGQRFTEGWKPNPGV